MENSLLIDDAIIIVMLVAEVLFHIAIVMTLSRLLKILRKEK